MGPLEFLVLTFPGEVPGASAVEALEKLRSSGEVKVVDTLLVSKDAEGAVSAAELRDIAELKHAVSDADLADLISGEDLEEVGQTLEPGSCALAVLIEHTWATAAAESVRAAGGRIAASVRIPAEHLQGV